MLTFIRTLLLGFLFFLFLGCALFDSGTDNIVDDYDVTWIDLHEQRALYKRERLVPPYVFAAEHNAKFIFAKQHPFLLNSKEIIDKTVVNYYIIERTETEFQDKPKYGPLTKAEFDKKCAELGIIDPEFDMTYPTNLY